MFNEILKLILVRHAADPVTAPKDLVLVVGRKIYTSLLSHPALRGSEDRRIAGAEVVCAPYDCRDEYVILLVNRSEYDGQA